MTSSNLELDDDDVVVEVVEVVTGCPLRVVPRPTTPTQRSLRTH